ncbi:MAG: 2'-5' RNA ligase family protein [Rhodospirillaceae bacterium]
MEIAMTSQQLSFFSGGETLRRLFFAVLPDAAAAACTADIMEQLRARGALSGRPVEPDRLHVSLQHLGDFIDQLPKHLVTTAETAAAAVVMEPFEVAFDRAGGTRGPFILRASDNAAALQSFRRPG